MPYFWIIQRCFLRPNCPPYSETVSGMLRLTVGLRCFLHLQMILEKPN